MSSNHNPLTVALLALGLVSSAIPVMAAPNATTPSTLTPQSACVPAAERYARRFRLGGAVNSPKTFDYTALKQYAPSKANVAYYSGSAGLVTTSYVGVLLYDLLSKAGVITDPDIKNDLNRKYVVITATDCYQTIVSYAEIDPGFGGQPVLVAYENADGTPLGSSEGMARLVVPGDKKGGRYVSNVKSITVRSAP
ncbi:MAG TPA: molybdopterin-dependent oxidoreductase [Methylococcaceae bacterium]|jgi:DMSO/TMAO reductase YedYZ molybdopterin-dependent catalytic subunit|nr:molybdopterin-dependent oxidoreductase [Methylococcaceae bacterium]